jgi:hypothetical protein
VAYASQFADRSGRERAEFQQPESESSVAKKAATAGSWQPGQSGNPGGAAKDRAFRQAIVMELTSKDENMPELRTIARNLINTAKQADHANCLAATKEIADRLDGKSPVMVTSDADEFRKATELTDAELLARIDAGLVDS